MLYNRDMKPSKYKTSYSKTPTIQQRKFVANLVSNDGDIKQAALDADYSEKSAMSSGSRLLTKSHIQNEIQAVLAKSGASVGELSKKLKKSIDSGLGEKATNSDALRGIEMAFRLHGAFPDKKVQVESRSVSLSLKGESMDDLGGKLDELLAESNRIRDTVVVDEEATGQDEDTTS